MSISTEHSSQIAVSAYEASHPERRPRAPILPDERQRVTTTAAYPYRAIAHLTIIPPSGKGSFIGTGFFLGPHLLITAGHCVFFRGSEFGWAKEIQVSAGVDGKNNTPFGASILANRFQSNTGWTENGLDASDYGAILLDTDLGKQTGTIAVDEVEGTPSGQFEIAGYPTLTPPELRVPADKTMWRHTGPLVPSTADSLLTTIDTSPGQSGSPLLSNANGRVSAIGILIEAQSGSNRALRLTPQMREHLIYWLRM